MADNQFIINTDHLFEDVDDETFLKNSHKSTNPFANDLQQQKQMYEDQRREIEQRTLNSTNRSLGLLHETEQVGIATAEELSRQRETLEKTSRQLDDINTNLRYSQKHLNGLKSLFGGLKNYLSGQKDPGTRLTSSPSGSKISENATTPNRMSPDELYDTHPINRLRSDNTGSQTITSSSFSQQLDRNLDEMVNNLSKLKGLATDLGQEIESQNVLIDDIHDKTENAEVKIKRQNTEMNKLLGKK